MESGAILRKFLALLCLSLPAFGQVGISNGPNPTHGSPTYSMPAGKIYIDTTTLASGRVGFSAERSTTCVGPRTGGSCDALSTPAGPFENGAFRISCPVSHMGFDDPIVQPGRPGVTHLHDFFGNNTTNSATTLTNLAQIGTSTCVGGTFNRTGYWTPGLVYHCPNPDLVPCTASRNGEVYTPSGNNVYYKTGTLASVSGVQWPPANFRMIAGSSTATMPQSYDGRSSLFFVCLARSGGSDGPNKQSPAYIPSTSEDRADRGTLTYCELNQFVGFGVCWDGVNIDSPDHQSHVTGIDFNLGCNNPSFPVQFPVIAVNVHHIVLQADLDYVRLSSDPPEVTGLTQTSADTMHIKLAASESSTTDFYKYGLVCVALECRRVTAYDGTTKIATVASAFSSLPASGSRYAARQPGGTTSHSDWANGWDQTTVVVNGKTITDIILDKCLKNRGDCNNHLLGDPNPSHDLTGDVNNVWWYYLY